MRLSGVRSGLIWVLEMKVMNELRCMSELVSQQPGSFFVCTLVSGPTDEVQEFAIPVSTVDLQVEDLLISYSGLLSMSTRGGGVCTRLGIMLGVVGSSCEMWKME